MSALQHRALLPRASLRPARRPDLRAVAALHRDAIPTALASRLGARFLRRFYGHVLDHERSVFLVAEQDGDLVGYAAGFRDPSAFYARLREDVLGMGLAAAPGLVRRPTLLAPLLSRRALGSSGHGAGPEDVELAGIAVAPAVRGAGLGTALLDAFTAGAASLGARAVVATTDARDNNAANALYRRNGFNLAGTVPVAEGRSLHQYVRPLERPAESGPLGREVST